MRVHRSTIHVLCLLAAFGAGGCAAGESALHGDGGGQAPSDSSSSPETGAAEAGGAEAGSYDAGVVDSAVADSSSNDAVVDAPVERDAGADGFSDAHAGVDAAEAGTALEDAATDAVAEPDAPSSDGATGGDASPADGSSDAPFDAGHDAGHDAAAADASPFEAGTDASSTDAGPDGAAIDAGTDSAPPVDAGTDSAPVDAGLDAPHDAAVDAWDGSTCLVVTTPASDAGEPDPASCSFGGAVCTPAATSYTATAWIPPTHEATCTAAQITNFYDLCFLGTTGKFSDCLTWVGEAANSACAPCLFTQRGASANGPLIYQTVPADGGVTEYFMSMNIAGCVSLFEPCNSGCAQILQSADDCETAACNTTSCADDPNAADYNTCVSEADDCACYGFAVASNSCWSELSPASAHPASICQDMGSPDAAVFEAVAEKFCGNGK